MNRIHPVIYVCFVLCFICIGSITHAEVVNPATVFDSSNFAEAQHVKALLEQPEDVIDFA
jgi:hypothetical protein